MKTVIAISAALMFAAGSAGACEWMKTAKQSVKAPTATTVASVEGPQSKPVKQN